MLIQAAKHKNVIMNMVWETGGPGIFGTCNLSCIFKYKQTNQILPNDNPNHQIKKYSN